jgi:predicted HTH transcriptional regulator
MFEEMEASFLYPPELAIEAGVFTVRLRNEPIFVGPSAEWQAIIGRLGLSVPQKRALLAHPEGFTNEDYRRLNRVDRDEAYRQIQDMIALGVLLPAEGPGRGATYHVAPDFRSMRAFLEGRLPQLRQVLARQPFLKNADYRRLFGVTRLNAVRELARLVDEGYLRLEGRGRGARYIAGEKLKQSPGGRQNESQNESL